MEHDLSAQLFRLTEGVGRIEANQAAWKDSNAALTARVDAMHQTIRESVQAGRNADQKIESLGIKHGELASRLDRVERRPGRMLRWVAGACVTGGIFLATAVGEPVIRSIAEFKLKAWGGHP